MNFLHWLLLGMAGWLSAVIFILLMVRSATKNDSYLEYEENNLINLN